MNTIVRIVVISNMSTVFTREKIAEALDKFDYVVKKFTRFSEKSELSRLNNSGGKPTVVSDEMFVLVKKMLDLADKTDGVYDPTIIDLLEAYGFDKKNNFKNLEKPQLYKEIREIINNRHSFREIELNNERRIIKLQRNQRLDLGSIGKGYAIDLASETLDVFDSFIINAGGDIRTKGKNIDGNFWKVGLYKAQLPNQAIPKEDIWGKVEMKNFALAASGGWSRRVKFFHHLLNPKTGAPENEISQTFILSKTATEADAWSTALFLGGQKTLKKLPRNIEAMLIDKNGTIHKTKNFEILD